MNTRKNMPIIMLVSKNQNNRTFYITEQLAWWFFTDVDWLRQFYFKIVKNWAMYFGTDVEMLSEI